MRTIPRIICLWLFCTAFTAVGIGAETASPLLQAMREELNRSIDLLKRQPVPPYYLSYEITETHLIRIGASFGALSYNNERRSRMLDVDLRVGDYALDNTHPVRGSISNWSDRYSRIGIPIEDDIDAVRAVLWYHTDKKYKRALEQLTTVKTNVQVKVEEEDQSDDFSREPVERYVVEPASLNVPRDEWVDRVKRYTAPFAKDGNIYDASASLLATVSTRQYVNSEGSEIQTSQVRYRLFIYAFTKADDGMELPRYESFSAFTLEELPGDDEVLALVDKMIADLQALRDAPVVAPYAGPAILSGRASGVLFHEIFGHRIEGHRQKREEEGQTFKRKIGERVLPETFSVVFDPTTKRIAGKDLVGAYAYDNQGVRARRVAVVENGIFRRFLMSRSPIENFPNSNGHGRKAPGYAPVARQSNLIVETSEPQSRDRLKEMLIEQCRKEGKEFGLYFEDIQGGFTITGRFIPNAFNVLPIMVYRIYTDGREELVRGVDLIGTPLTAFSRIAAADDRIGVFNGMCGAESGGVPVSAVSPGIFISQIEVQKKPKSQERRPILDAPPSEAPEEETGGLL
ncbi:MAG: TldD/PmbA family protein [Candidatus Latescibacteria bacterium]|nr:TldD/PmbA family protein [Candidatus Latescibacterota bacterium]